MQSDQKLYTTIFTDSNQQSVNQVPYFIKDYDINRKQVYSSAQSSELLILGHYNCVSIIDTITRNFTIEYINMTNQGGCIVTAVGIGYYNNYIIIGAQSGALHIMNLSNSIKQFDVVSTIEIRYFSKFKISNVFATNGDLVIVISINGIKFFYANQLPIQKSKKATLTSSEIETVSELFPVGISASAFCHFSNQLIVALGDQSIRVYTFIGEDVNGSLKRVKVYYIEQMEIVNKLSVSNDGRLLAISQCKLINGMEYNILIMDLKRKGKIIKKYNYQDAGEVYDMKFFPVSNKLFVTVNTGSYYIVDIDVFGDNRMYLTQQTELTKNIYPMSQYQEFPNFLQISENGIISILAFDSPKIDYLMQMPFLYFVEMRLSEIFDYKPLLQSYFQTSFYMGFSGIDKKNASSQVLMLNGEQFFEPLYDGVLKMSEFKQFYKEEFQKRIKYRRKRYELPVQIASWALNNIKKSKFQSPEFLKFPDIQLKKNESENVQVENKQEKRMSKKKKRAPMRKLEQLFDLSQDSDEKMIQNLGEGVEGYMRQYNDMKLSDDRYILISKLILNLQYQNLTMLLLGNCSLLFDVRLPFKEYIIDMINRIDRLSYLDLSNDKITFEDIKKITRLTQLKFLDLSCNHLGNQSKQPMVKQKAKFQNLDNQEEEHLNQDDEFSFYKLLFQKIPIINLRNNYFTDEEGVQLIQSLEDNEDVRVLDLSGNLLFNQLTRFQLTSLIQNKPNQLKATQTLIIEFNEQISESSMKQLTKQMIEKQSSEQQESMNFYLYVVNSNQNYYWDQSLLQLYERTDEQNDEIKSCFYAFFSVCFKIFTDQYENIKVNFLACLKQCFCSLYFLQKYIVCCYCVFLQSEQGSWITHLLGIKTADYEYNNKKDDLKRYLENSKYPLNFIFWVNFIAFYFICIFVPIFFVLSCKGHQWTGHFIYCGYAFFVCILEIQLARTCIKHQITHHEFSSGPMWKRALHFGKDLFLSQMGKFDVYSDICFITTVMTCGDNTVIGYLAILIMVLTLGTTMYHLLHLLLSRQDGDENYIDYLCNYCSFVEIHLVGSLLEKWTIQNTTNFLWMKGIPNRVYAATFRTFAEDLPQFLLQVVYLFLNPNKKNIEILLLSLASSTVSIIISITKSLTITKANRINDQIMMNEVKNKLGLVKDPTDPKLKEELIQFLHDYYDNFDGEEQIQQLNYGVADLKHMRKQNDSATNIRAVKGTKQTNKIQIQKGVSMLVEQAGQKNLQKNPTVALDYEKLDFFEPYLFLMNSAQAKLIQKLYQQGLIQHQLIAQVLLELELTDYVDTVPVFANQMETYQFNEGSFIESLEVQIAILEIVYKKLVEDAENDISMLDLGCGSGFTATAILKLCEKLKQKSKFKILCVDHIPQILERARNVIELGFEDFLENQYIQFQEFDCRENLMGLGQFDIVNFGFAITNIADSQRLLLENGVAIVPIATLPQDHDYFLVRKDSATVILKAQAGQLQAKELQYPDFYQYYEIEKGHSCDRCNNQLDKGQFYSPWMRKYYCLECGRLDDQEEDQNQFKILSNLVFIPTTATVDDMKRVSSYKFGNNLFPKKNQTLTKRHSIDCHPCQREKGEENDFDPLPRYICLNCRPGKFDGQHLDICYECAECFIDDERENERDLKLNYLSGHKSSHLLLKIHFYYDYNKY